MAWMHLDFNPRPSYEGRHQVPAPVRPACPISIHAPHTRGDVSGFFIILRILTFQSTPLIRGATTYGATPRGGRHFNPRPSYEGRPVLTVYDCLVEDISIHAPHTRGDLHPLLSHRLTRYFNPRPSYEGRRYALQCIV